MHDIKKILKELGLEEKCEFPTIFMSTLSRRFARRLMGQKEDQKSTPCKGHYE